MADQSERLAEFIAAPGAMSVLTGAGLSTPSGIPDYRDLDGKYKIKQPIQFDEFARHAAARQRYWARSYVGWGRFGKAGPNAAHTALAKLEAAGKVRVSITQNVDGLQQRAGSQEVVELHGNLSRAICLSCRTIESRSSFQRRLRALNGNWHARVFEYKPDGDAELAEEDHTGFNVPDCSRCGGIIKPDVVMFGESVPPERVDQARASVATTERLLVVGSSLMLFSGYRFARQAHELGKPVAIVGLGKTRADSMAAFKAVSDCAEILPEALRLAGLDAQSSAAHQPTP